MQTIDTVEKTPCMDMPEVFFPEDFPHKEVKACAVLVARHLCNTCPIKRACFEYATERGEPYGIWAGTLPSER
tara:strand:+ start:550 stop:768 length:219 start_codon:yes stop_codon:yes gene_type:complete